MKILITGANGFLGYYLTEKLLQKKYTVIATGKGECRLPFTHYDNFIYSEMDFTDPFRVHDVIEKNSPDVVVHAGAISKVDDCELNQWEAYRINTEATVTMLINAEEYKSFFVFISTDFYLTVKEECTKKMINRILSVFMAKQNWKQKKRSKNIPATGPLSVQY